MHERVWLLACSAGRISADLAETAEWKKLFSVELR